MLRAPVLLVALLISSPIIWQALVDGSVSVETAVVRFLIAIPVAAVLCGLVRLAATHRNNSGEHAPLSRESKRS